MATVTRREPARPAHRGRRIGNIASTVAVGVFVVAAVALALALTLVPAIAGGRTLTVLTGSMRPAIPAGSVVVVRPVAPESLVVGDVITYATIDPVSGHDELVTHRVAELRPGGVFITKGDANRVPDSRPVAASQVRGKVWYHIPIVGELRGDLVSPAGAAYAGAALLLAFGWFVLRGRKKHDTDNGDRAAP
ncbi:MAG: signal peptidase I [Sciscionella sp.]